MRYPRLLNLLIGLLACGLLSLSTIVQAASPEKSPTMIILDKAVKFEDPQGEEIMIESGTYAVSAGNGTLSLSSSDSKTSIIIDANENSHDAEIPLATAASIPGQDGPLANTHLVILYLPNGQALQAIGTYPGIRSRGISEDVDLPSSPTTVTFEKAVYFIAPDGSPVIAEPGTYTAEDAQDWIRLIPGKERRKALLIETQKGTNDTEIDALIALSLPGSTENELDLHHMMLLLPTGETLEATGSYSGIQPRGFNFKKSLNKAKKRASRTYRKARGTTRKTGRSIGSTAKKVGKGASQAALKAKRAAEHAAKMAAVKAKQIAQQTAKFAKIQACKATVGLIKGGKTVAGFMKNVIPSAKRKNKNAENRFKNDKSFHDQLIAKITHNLQTHKAKIPELKRIAKSMNKTKKKLDAIFSTNTFCSDSVSMMDKKLMQLGMVPKFALVRSRGAQDEHFYLGYQITLGGGIGIGLQVGLMGVTDLRGNGGKYWFIGPQGVTNATVGLTAEVAFFPKVSLDSFKGWGSGIGISAGPPSKIVSGAVDVMLDEKVKQFQGFGFGPGVGVGLSPVDAAFSYTHSWKY